MLVMLTLSHLEVPTDGGFIEVEAHGLQSENQQLLVSARFCGSSNGSLESCDPDTNNLLGNNATTLVRLPQSKNLALTRSC